MPQALRPTTELANRIAILYPTLSAAHRRAADIVLQSPLDAATGTIEDFAALSGVSAATATRFVRTLGYETYSDFRGALSQALKIARDPVAKLAEGRAAGGDRFATMSAALTEQAGNVQEMIDHLDKKSVSAAVTALLKARRIYLVGAGVSHHIAGFLQDGLAIYLDAGVIFVGSRGGPETAVPLLMPAGPKDLVVAISMPRYSQMTLDLARFAKRRGAPVLGLTDAPSSPLAALSDITLFTPARNRLMPNSPTAAFALVDALITTIARERPNAVEALKELSDSLIWTFHR